MKKIMTILMVLLLAASASAFFAEPEYTVVEERNGITIVELPERAPITSIGVVSTPTHQWVWEQPERCLMDNSFRTTIGFYYESPFTGNSFCYIPTRSGNNNNDESSNGNGNGNGNGNNEDYDEVTIPVKPTPPENGETGSDNGDNGSELTCKQQCRADFPPPRNLESRMGFVMCLVSCH